MRFAILDGERRTPIKGKRGVCEFCGGDLVAKCGRYKIWHWAHMPGGSCDPWWGPETAWHLEWKNQFPENWQEIVHRDEITGEKHIADVKSPHGLVIEFQHSPLNNEELVSRETFYQNMIWVVDGDRGGLDVSYFNMGLSREPASSCPLVHMVEWWSTSRLLHKWAAATAPVYIDFGICGLWRFLDFFPDKDVGVFSPTEREWLVEACMDGESVGVSCLDEEYEETYLSQPQLVDARHIEL